MIYIVWGVPGAGKTFYATWRALREMKRKKGKKVISNYPIYDKKNKQYSYKWKPEYVYESVYDSLIIVDEAYRDYNARNFKNFDMDMHTFFATNRHNGNDFIIIAQNPARIDTVIREMANFFYYVQAFKIPVIWRPLYFKISAYLMVEDFTSDRKPYYIKRYLFSKVVAKAYDTLFYRASGDALELTRWYDDDIVPVDD